MRSTERVQVAPVDEGWPVGSKQSGEILPYRWESTALRITARVGVWGLFTGFGALLVDTLVSGLPFSIVGPLAGLGFVFGGVGTALASGLTLRRVRRSLRRLTLASALGIPFGLASATVGISMFFPHFLERLFPAWASLVLILAPVLAVLLGVGVVAKLFSSGRDNG